MNAVHFSKPVCVCWKRFECILISEIIAVSGFCLRLWEIYFLVCQFCSYSGVHPFVYITLPSSYHSTGNEISGRTSPEENFKQTGSRANGIVFDDTLKKKCTG